MARKLGNQHQAQATPAATTRQAEAAAEQAGVVSILHPEREVMIGKRAVEVREYGYVEGLKLQGACKDFLSALFGLFAQAAAPPPAEAVSDLFADHIVTVQWLIAQAITPIVDDPEVFVAAVASNAKWVASLDEVWGDALTAIWWEVNKGFFIRRLRRRAQAELEAARRASALSASTTP